MNLAFFIGPHGGDFLAVQSAIDKGLISAKVTAMVGVKDGSPALDRYRQLSGGDSLVRSFARQHRSSHFRQAQDFLQAREIDLLLLAGFPFIVPPELLDAYPNRIINAHHSLLPSHPGLYRKEARVASTDRFLGATVHRVDAGVDTGKILYQAVFPNTGMVDFNAILRRYRQAQDLMIVQCIRDLSRGLERTHSHCRCADTLFSPAIDTDIIQGMGDG